VAAGISDDGNPIDFNAIGSRAGRSVLTPVPRQHAMCICLRPN
jgi:hypothetical protein